MRVLVLGSKGMLGQEITRVFSAPHAVTAWDKEEGDLLAAVARGKIIAAQPEIIINCTAYNAVDAAEAEQKELAWQINATVPEMLAQVAQELDVPLVHFSSDYVFSGEHPTGYTETAVPAPINYYGQSKLGGEQAVQKHATKFYLIRLSRLFGQPTAGGKKSFVDLVVQLAAEKSELQMVDEEMSAPTYAPDLAQAVLALINERASYGIYHLPNSGACTWYEWAQEILAAANLSTPVRAITSQNLTRLARRPAHSVLINSQRPALRPWPAAVREYLAPDFSLVTVGYKSRDYLRALVESVLAGRADFSVEHFIVDNASGDGTLAMLRQEFLPRTDKKFNLHLIANETNRGFAAANNQALRQARGKFIILLNPDMRLQADTLTNLWHWLQVNPQAAVTGISLVTAAGKNLPQARRFPGLWDQLMILFKVPHVAPRVVKNYLQTDFNFLRSQTVDSVRGSFMVIRPEVLAEVGLLDERYFIWFEEVDFCKQVREAGYQVWYTPAAQATDFVGRSFALVSGWQKQRYFTTSMVEYFRKWHPVRGLVLAVVRPLILGTYWLVDKMKNKKVL